MIGIGFRRWKAYNLKPILAGSAMDVCFVSDVEAARRAEPKPGDCLFFWGARPPTGLIELAKACWAHAVYVEDGFVRSVGLGSDLIRPLSLVLDKRGIYFDPTHESDLECMLNTECFSDDELERARVVRAFIVENGITKYNLEARQCAQWENKGRAIVLVPGQVEDDASIKMGCTRVRTNLSLLKTVREARPDAFIVYKPHPDVLSRNRRGKIALDEVRRFADHVEAGVSVVNCIEACDEVHTMTSLAGFDALLRGKPVVTYGQPFYAGWGLTEDRAENPTAFVRRTRRLTVDELVAGALLRYPIYWDWDSMSYATCEAVLRRIVEERTALEANEGLQLLREGFLRRQIRKLDVLIRSYLAT